MKTRQVASGVGSAAKSVATSVGHGVASAWRQLSLEARRRLLATRRRELESRKLDKFQQMGKMVYSMYTRDRVRSARMQSVCREVEDLNESIRQLTREISQLGRSDEQQ